MNGSRSAATTGGRIALRTATAAATTNAAPGLSSVTPGTMIAATYSVAAAIAHETSRRRGRRRGFVGSHVTASPCVVVSRPHHADRRQCAVTSARSAAGYRRRHASVRGGRARRMGRLPDGAARAARRRDRARGQVVVRGGGRRRGRGRPAREAGRHGDVLHGPRQRRPRAPCGRRSCAAHGVEVEAVVRDRPQRRGVALLDARGERTIAVQGERLVPNGDDDLPWDRLAEMDGVYFTGGDAASLRAARAARTLVATPRARDAITGSDVTLDALVRSAGDAGEQDDRERRGWSARLTVATRGPDGGTYATDDGRTGSFEAAPLTGPVVDAYGAGDSFAAGLTFGLGSGMDVDAALALAARCGAGNLTARAPTRDSRPQRTWACSSNGLPVGRADRDHARRSARRRRGGRRRPACVLGDRPRRPGWIRGDEMCPSGRGQVLIPWPNRLEDGSYEFEGERISSRSTNRIAQRDPRPRPLGWMDCRRARAPPSGHAAPAPSPARLSVLACPCDRVPAVGGGPHRADHRHERRLAGVPLRERAHPYLLAGTPTVDSAVLQSPAATVLQANERGIPVGEIGRSRERTTTSAGPDDRLRLTWTTASPISSAMTTGSRA